MKQVYPFIISMKSSFTDFRARKLIKPFLPVLIFVSLGPFLAFNWTPSSRVQEVAAAQMAGYTPTLVQMIDTSQWSPPSPDPAGIVFLGSSNTLLIADSEVNEIPALFRGDNLFEMTSSGTLSNTMTTTGFSNEPTGVAYNPGNGHIFISDDDNREIYEIDPGGDSQYGTPDDIVTSFDTADFGSYDPEGVTFDSLEGVLFIVDRNYSEVYRINPGGNGVFDGVPPAGDDLLTHFDTYDFGIRNPEGIAFNPDIGHLYVVGEPENSFAEITTGGDLVQIFDISAASAVQPSGLAYGPGSLDPNTTTIYITDRGVDNNNDPNENDGKVYEFTLPPNTNVPPVANNDIISTGQILPIIIDVVENDSDINGNLDLGSANIACSFGSTGCTGTDNGLLINNNDGTFTYTPALGFLGNDLFVYEICDIEPLCDTATVTITVTGVSVEVSVSTSSDDAEEKASGSVSLTSTDLELVYDGSDQTVGMRFNGADIPKGATITNAYIQFQVDETNDVPTSLTIQGEAVDNAVTFTSTSGDISSRPRTTATVSWTPVPWMTVGEVGLDQRTPNIASVIQEIVDREGWVSGNALAIIVTGTGERTGESYNGNQAGAPLLHVEHALAGAPVVAMSLPTEGATFNEGDSIDFSATAVDGEDGNLTGNISWVSNIDGAIGNGGTFSSATLSPGIHTITASATDSNGLTDTDTTQFRVFASSTVIVGAGDIARCSSVEDDMTADLLDNIPGTVFTLGDNAYSDGTETEFSECYDPTWGRHKGRTRPSLGNHDYHTAGAAGYFNYFGDAAGEVGKGYYSYDVGDWHIIVLDSECAAVGGCDSASPQGQWLQADLAANPRSCTLAYWHKPLFSSVSNYGINSDMYDFWALLYQVGADVVLNGHRHVYERYAPQDPDGVADPVNGIREFVVGTGGTNLYTFGAAQPNSEVRESNTHGVLKLTLHPTSYDWEFIPIAGQTFTDSGTADCVGPMSQSPVSNNDSYTTVEDTSLSVSAPGVLGNDTDADGDPLTAVLVGDASNGTLNLNSDGSFSYIPNADFNGSDSFTYKANDGTQGSNVATVTITVNPVNDPPVAVDDTGTVAEGGTLNEPAPGVLGNDSDPDGDSLTVKTTPVTAPNNGTLTLNADGSYTYIHNGSQNTSDSFVYEVSDGNGGTATAIVNLTITGANDPPVAMDDMGTVAEGGTLNEPAPGVLGNDSDPDGDSLTVNTTPVTAPNNGALTLNANGSYTYIHNGSQTTSDSFVYEVCDDLGLCDTATVSLNITQVAEVVIEVRVSASADDAEERASGNVNLTSSDLELVFDTSDQTVGMRFNTVAIPQGATILKAYIQFQTDETNSESTSLTIQGEYSDNAAAFTTTNGNISSRPKTTAAVSWNPVSWTAVGEAGPDQQTPDIYMVIQEIVGRPGWVSGNSLVAIVTGTGHRTAEAYDGEPAGAPLLHVEYLSEVENNAPVAMDDTYTTDEDTPLNVAAPGVLYNDSDADLDPLAALLVGDVSNGTLTLNGDGSFTYTPDPDLNGSDSFTYKANDGTVDSNVATVTITVNAVNDPPVADDQSVTTGEDATAAVTLTGSDVDGDGLTFSVVAGPSNGTLGGTAPNLTYTPNPDFNGGDSFTFKANDGTVDSNVATVTITVNAVNDPPMADDQSVTTDEDATAAVTLTGSDVDGDGLTFSVVAGPSNGTLGGTAPNLTYTPNPDFNGGDSFTFKANDGTVDSNVATVTITVNAVNDPPMSDDQSVTTGEDTTVAVTLAGSDVDGDGLTFSVVAGPSNGTLGGTAPNLTYTPNADFNGGDSFTFKANDGTVDSNIATVSLTVTPVNDPPLAVNDSASTMQDNPVIISVLANDIDVDGNSLSLATVDTSSTNGGTISTNPDGTVTYSPAPGFLGNDTFTYTASDGTASSNLATVNVTVFQTNQAPVANDDGYTTDEDTPLSVAAQGVLNNDTDADLDLLTALLVGDVSNGTLTLNGNGSFTYTPNPEFNGSESFTYKANDGLVDSNTATVSITVNPINDPPVADDQSIMTDEDTAVAVTLTGSDVDGDGLTFTVVAGPSSGTLSGTAPILTYTPNADFNGGDSFTFKANDGTVDSNVATVTINVNAVNDPPQADDQFVMTDEDTPVAVTLTGSDVDGDGLTFSVVAGPSSGTLSGTPPNLTYVPNADFNGGDSFTFKANDGTVDSNMATVTINVNAVNDPPQADDQFVMTDEDTPVAVTLTGSDVDGDGLTFSVVAGPSNGTLDGTAPNLTYTPNADFNGGDSFTYKANDGTVDSNIATVSLTVNPVNDAPIAGDDTGTVTQGSTLIEPAPGLLANDTDPESNPMTVNTTPVTAPANGTLTLNADGSYTYTHDGSATTTDSFVYEVCDSGALCSTATVTITITASSIVDAFATSDVSVAGTVTGDFTYTHEDDGNAQSITEWESGGKPENRHSYLEHKWTFDVTPGNVITLFINAWSSGSSDGDIFNIAYSTDDTSYFDIITVSNLTDNGEVSHVLPSDVQGTVYVRVTDSDQAVGNQVLDTIFVDHLFIRIETQLGDPPAAPFGLSGTATSPGQIDLSWTDNAVDEYGFYIERSDNGSNWSQIDTVGMDVTTFTDPTVFPDTTYFYRVKAYNGSGSSGYSNLVTVTTPAGLNLTGTGYKVKGVQTVDLVWSGGAATSFDIYRDGNLITSGVTGNSYTDDIGFKASGSYQYQVCEADNTVYCSNFVQINF